MFTDSIMTGATGDGITMYKFFLFGTVAVFIVIGTMGWMRQKSGRQAQMNPVESQGLVQEISLKPEIKTISPPLKTHPLTTAVKASHTKSDMQAATVSSDHLPDADRIGQLFALDSSRLPYVETLSYTSRVPWLEGRPAWIADYATHYETSRHFIARSLNRKVDYLNQKISPGDRFNVFRRDKKIEFHLLVDISRCRMWFYCFDKEGNERILLKTYSVGLGRLDTKKPSGSLTPLGKYSLGDKVAIYKPGTQGFFQDKKVEMIQVFGTRWIPFHQEIEGCTEPAKALGIHGVPWLMDPLNGNLIEDRSKIGKYDSDGCIRLAQEDIEEIFSIIITKPTTIQIVKDFQEAKLPGTERNL